jgi:hypothetical protein
MAALDRILPNGYFAAIAAVSSFQNAGNLALTRNSQILQFSYDREYYAPA